MLLPTVFESRERYFSTRDKEILGRWKWKRLLSRRPAILVAFPAAAYHSPHSRAFSFPSALGSETLSHRDRYRGGVFCLL